MQERLNSSASAMELHLSCINPSIYWSNAGRWNSPQTKKRSAYIKSWYCSCWCLNYAGASTDMILTWELIWYDIKMSSYWYRKSHCGNKLILLLSYLHNVISYTGKTSLYWTWKIPLQTYGELRSYWWCNVTGLGIRSWQNLEIAEAIKSSEGVPFTNRD